MKCPPITSGGMTGPICELNREPFHLCGPMVQSARRAIFFLRENPLDLRGLTLYQFCFCCSPASASVERIWDQILHRFIFTARRGAERLFIEAGSPIVLIGDLLMDHRLRPAVSLYLSSALMRILFTSLLEPVYRYGEASRRAWLRCKQTMLRSWIPALRHPSVHGHRGPCWNGACASRTPADPA